MLIAQFSAWPLGDSDKEMDVDVVSSATEGEILLNIQSFVLCSIGFHKVHPKCHISKGT